MVDLSLALIRTLRSALMTQRELVLENLALRQQLSVLRRSGRRPRLRVADRLLWVWLRRAWAAWREALVLVQPATVVRWHRELFRRHWTWKSRRRRPGRPQVSREVRELVRRMVRANPLWGAPRVHGELLKLGLPVSQRTVSRLMPRRSGPPLQTWRAFLDTHVKDLVSIDFFTGPTACFRVLFAFLRTHPALAKDAPEARAIQPPTRGEVVELPEVGGLHHRYERRAA